MAIYIKGVTMPKHRAIDLTITPDGSAIIWGTTHRLLDEKCTYIPEPHGRLIDADVYKSQFQFWSEYDDECLDKTPTVIEGSE